MPISREDIINSGMAAWKPIKNYESLYLISSDGRIYSIRNNRELKSRTNCRHGYIEISLCNNGDERYFRVHRLVAEAFIPNPINKPFVNHIDGNKTNNDISNLEWCTGTENNIHAIKTGLVNLQRAKYIFFNQKEYYTFDSQKELCKFANICSNSISNMLHNFYRLQKGKFEGFTCFKFHRTHNITLNDYRKLKELAFNE